ncbi:hypothetical protein [Qipengyuania citrea]|uniref:hypothetical protein n=1 Tax=Qipengyuania citrea TaxID=225971 RepID=UPI00067E8965|nr:hypothetical protein [Qipengyuania citrea]
MNDETFRAMSCRPWDGCWRVRKPDGFDGLLSIHQFTALQVLRSGVHLSEAEARLLQAIHYQSDPLGPAQSFNLERLTSRASETLGRVAA